MKNNYARMTKAELIEALQFLERNATRPSPELAAPYDRLLHDLQVHQEELSVQNQSLREAQKLLEESRSRYAELYDLAPVGYVTLDGQGLIREINLTGATLLGIERSRLIGLPFVQYVANEDRAPFREHVRRCQSEAGPTSTELQLLRPDASVFPVELHSVPITRSAGSTAGCLTALVDITERKRADALVRETMRLLQESETQLAQELADTLQLQKVSSQLVQPGNAEGLYEKILETAIAVMCSDMGSIHMLDSDTNELRLLASKGFHPLSAAFWQKVAVESSSSGTVALRQKERVIVPDVETCDWMTGTRDLDEFRRSGICAMQSTPLVSRSGRVVGMISTHWREYHEPPETQLHLLEVLARQAADFIERARAEQALEHQKTELLAANSDLESFSYSVSHDLRAPVEAIASFASTILNDYGAQLPSEVISFAELIQGNAIQMSRLIEALLLLSRTSRHPLTRQTVAPLQVVQDVLPSLQPQLDGRQVEFVMGELPVCQADPVLFRQVYTNLLSNAVKFTRKRTGARIEVGAEVAQGETVYFVKDNGVGFDMEQADKLFGVFQRLHGEEEYEGTGIGLAIVHRIIRRHGGHVWAEGQVGRGASFYFTLPEGGGRSLEMSVQ